MPKTNTTRHSPIRVALMLIAAATAFGVSTNAAAQIVSPSLTVTPRDPIATLSDQLINRLHATQQDQREYLAIVLGKVKSGALDARLVVAIQRYAIKRNSSFPFPFFERAMQYEAAKRGVKLPTYHEVASTSRPMPGR
ncbi:hypothetical protein Poly51_56700 [Rubripirellula tenax]|uniref:Uncharacterized protein n=1 Tax=Rubripirellula tenax TaxID=2528015 RepID=A0A5C6ECU4_9BACT|nr:hypothetical protein [Rubripirellula tenax]TWU46274.1 hypothetical protein Poly51_56700 [Rubripirellula tenax]